jgi:hypothetical protein
MNPLPNPFEPMFRLIEQYEVAFKATAQELASKSRELELLKADRCITWKEAADFLGVQIRLAKKVLADCKVVRHGQKFERIRYSDMLAVLEKRGIPAAKVEAIKQDASEAERRSRKRTSARP